MQALKNLFAKVRSSVLVVGHPSSDPISFGADSAPDFAVARELVNGARYSVIVTSCSSANSDRVSELLELVGTLSPLSQLVIVQNDTPAEALRRIINVGSVFRILPSFDDPNFDLTVQQALEEYNQLEQNAKLLQLVNEQNERLKRLTTELEERVEARRKSLEDAKQKLLVTNHRVEALHRALVAIHKAGSLGEMERLVTEALGSALGLSWTRILFDSSGSAANLANGSPGGSASALSNFGTKALEAAASRGFALYKAALTRGRDPLGTIFFARPSERPFTKDENSFLGQVADAVSLAIDRLMKLDQAETLKHQWEATFDAILDPVSLIDEDFTVVRINRSFAVQSGTEPENVIGRKCFEALFARTAPCEGCTIGPRKAGGGSNFRLKPSRTNGGTNAIYDVFSQRIENRERFLPEDSALFVNMYHDVSEQLRLERQILESAKMAELGTIGSSIAHELNNPLGGMLSFLQLIKMEIDGEVAKGSPRPVWYDDIDEMEKGARRCRDIVQSLLGFTRKSVGDGGDVIDLREAIEQALKITELQTRAMGIAVRLNLPDTHVSFRGQFNAIAQAIRNFLQNAQEAIAERVRSGDKTPGEITVNLCDEGEDWLVEIHDNGAGIDPQVEPQILDATYTTKDPTHNPGLGLSVSQQIIGDHGGRFELGSEKGKGTIARIRLPKA